MSELMTVPSMPAAAEERVLPAQAADKSARPERLAPLTLSRRKTGHWALSVLAVLAIVYTLDWAQSLLITIVVSVFLGYLLHPVVARLVRARVPRPMAATLVMVWLSLVVGSGAYALQGQVHNILHELPTAATKLSAGVAAIRREQSINLKSVDSAIQELKKATAVTGSADQQARARPAPQPQPSGLTQVPVGDVLWSGSVGAIGAIAHAVEIFFLVFFLLLSGHLYKRKLMRLAGSGYKARKAMVILLDDINGSIQRYMGVLLVTNLLVGGVSWAAYQVLGLDNAGGWAVMATVLHLIPYFGPLITAVITAIAGFMQTGDFSLAASVAAASLVIATVVGHFIATWMTGKVGSMNTTVVFVSLIFWGWLWGVWGMLLSFPIMVVLAVIARHVDTLRTASELMGDA